MDIFMRIDGIQGDSDDSRHKDWFDVQAVSGGVEQEITGTVSSGGTITGQRADFSDVSVLKLLDSGSAKLLANAAAGTIFKTVEIQFARSTGDKQPYYIIKLTNVLISAVKQNGVADGPSPVPTELVTFKFSKIEWTYTKIGSDGKPQGNVSGGWDLAENKKI